MLFGDGERDSFASLSGADQPITTEEIIRRIEARNQEAMEAEMEEEAFDWGGDGRDLHRPVRAYVEAALVATDAPYPPPVDKLPRLGDRRQRADWDQPIKEIGFTQEHVPDLVRMARDRALNTAMGNTDEVWAPIHALHALKHLDTRDVVADLVPVFDLEHDWIDVLLLDVFRPTGTAGLNVLETYIRDRSRWIYGRSLATSAMAQIAQHQPELRDRVVEILSDLLASSESNDPTLNGFLVSELLTLDAVEALPTIRKAFEQHAIDQLITGDWSRVLTSLGETPDPDDPLVARSRPSRNEARVASPSSIRSAIRIVSGDARTGSGKSSRSTAKSKRKMSNASRKTNRKKRK